MKPGLFSPAAQPRMGTAPTAAAVNRLAAAPLSAPRVAAQYWQTQDAAVAACCCDSNSSSSGPNSSKRQRALTFSQDCPLLAFVLVIHAALGAALLEGRHVDPPAGRPAAARVMGAWHFVGHPQRASPTACPISILCRLPAAAPTPLPSACLPTAWRSISLPPVWGRSRGWRRGPQPRWAAAHRTAGHCP